MSETENLRLLIIWITFTVVAAMAIITVIVWAVRHRQFSDQDRARYLALQSGTRGDAAPASPQENPSANSHADRNDEEGDHVSH